MGKTIYFIRCFLFFCICTGFLFSSSIAQEDDFKDEATRIILSYFDGLKNGDVQSLKTLLTDPMLSSRRLLLEQNTAYPEHLRNYYQDSDMLLTDVSLTDDSNIQIVTANIFFEGDENNLTIQFLLKNTDEGWKISEEESIP
jgi:hypothetical protein